MMRQRYPLDGQWDFIHDADSRFSVADVHAHAGTWQTVAVPAPWQSQIAGLETSTGTGWYRKSFSLDTLNHDESLILHVGAAYHYAQVWLNGRYLGDHDGGWLPFTFDLTAVARVDAPNELIIAVTVPDDDRQKYPNFPASETLHGKQTWYGAWGGLWQSVWIEKLCQQHIQHVDITYDLDAMTLTPTLELSNGSDALTWSYALMNADEEAVAELSAQPIDDARVTATTSLPPTLRRWSPDAPHLYTLRVSLYQQGRLIDQIDKTIGFRTLATRDGQLLLNGDPFYMRGALDQGYYPDTLATPPSTAFLKDQFRQVKALGLNTLRYHIKIADPRYYALADELGLLIWVDVPSWSLLTEKTKVRVTRTLQGMLRRDHHHPSIAIWTIVNEDWGTDLVHNERHRQWLNEMYHWLKAEDPSRLVVDNSPCAPNFHIESDIADYHYYHALPDNRHDWDASTERLTRRDQLPYSPHGDAHMTQHEPIIVSEFGNWGLPDVENLLDDAGNEPWWFETGSNWGEGIVYPHGVRERFQQWHLDTVFGAWKTLTQEMQWQQYRALKYAIETLRLRPQIAGYVITELTDLHWENNGLLDMRRQPRIFAEKLVPLNADALVIARADKHVYRSGETICLDLFLSQVNANTPSITTVEWQCGAAQGSLAVPNSQELVQQIGTLECTHTTDTPQVISVELYYRTADGERHYSNHYDVHLYPSAVPQPMTLAITDTTLSSRVEQMGYTLVDAWAEADVVIATSLTPELTAFVRDGGTALLIADHPDALPAYTPSTVIDATFPFTQLAERQSSIWNGDWVSTFAWLRRDGAFHALAGSYLMDRAFEALLPDYVLTGFDPQQFKTHVHAGMFAGWLHRHVALLGQRCYGAGSIFLTTFRLTNLEATNPLHQHFLSSLLYHANPNGEKDATNWSLP